MKKPFTKIIALLGALILMFTVSGCGKPNPPEPAPTAAPTQQAAVQPTQAPAEPTEAPDEPTEAPDEQPTQEPDDSPDDQPFIRGDLVLCPPSIDGLTLTSSGSDPLPEQFFYEESYEISGRDITLDNISVYASADGDESYEELVLRVIYNFISEQIVDEEVIAESDVDHGDNGNYGDYGDYLCYYISWTWSGDDQAYLSKGIAVLTDETVCMAYFSYPEADQSDVEGEIDSWLNGFDLCHKFLALCPPQIDGLEKASPGSVLLPEEVYYNDYYEISGRNISLNNMAVSASAQEGESNEDLVMRLIYEYAGEQIMDEYVYEADFENYIAFSISWLEAGDEDAYVSQGIMVLTDGTAYMAYFSYPETDRIEVEGEVALWLEGFMLY